MFYSSSFVQHKEFHDVFLDPFSSKTEFKAPTMSKTAPRSACLVPRNLSGAKISSSGRLSSFVNEKVQRWVQEKTVCGLPSIHLLRRGHGRVHCEHHTASGLISSLSSKSAPSTHRFTFFFEKRWCRHDPPRSRDHGGCIWNNRHDRRGAINFTTDFPGARIECSRVPRFSFSCTPSVGRPMWDTDWFSSIGNSRAMNWPTGWMKPRGWNTIRRVNCLIKFKE